MPALGEQERLRGNVMIVDDNPANLKLLEDMLRRRSYGVQSFPRGRLALAAAERQPPDLILLDINMPEMSGYETCERLKSSVRLRGVPVIFLSALATIEDKVKGFQSGGVDYISKPFQLEEVQARVDTQIRLRRAQEAEHDLLEKTLGGAVRALWELVQLTSPLLARRSQVIRDIVLRIAKETEIADLWQYELAAMLCLTGCITLPDEIFEKGYRGEDLPADEAQMFHAHPERAALLLSGIPRLEAVAGIIRWQHRPHDEPSGIRALRQGAFMLHLALELDRRICRGTRPDLALVELKLSGRFDERMIAAVKGYSPLPTEFEARRLPIRELRAGMVLEVDFFTKDGWLILKRQTVLTDTWIERMENFSRARGAQEHVEVSIPRLTGAPARL